MNNWMREVDYATYCPKCKSFKVLETDEPCHECLKARNNQLPLWRTNTHKLYLEVIIMDFMNSPYEDYTTEELDAKEKQLMYELELNKLKRKALDEQAYFLELKLSMINKTTPRKNQEFMPGDLAEEF